MEARRRSKSFVVGFERECGLWRMGFAKARLNFFMAASLRLKGFGSPTSAESIKFGQKVKNNQARLVAGLLKMRNEMSLLFFMRKAARASAKDCWNPRCDRGRNP